MAYQIGLTQVTMVELDALTLPVPVFDPLSTYNEFSTRRVRGDGLVVGTGRPTFVWKFNTLSFEQYQSLLYYLTSDGSVQASTWVYVRTRVPTGGTDTKTFKVFRVLMLAPTEPSDARYDRHERYANVTIKFMFASEVT